MPPFGYVATTASGRILLANDTVLSWLGRSRDEVQGKLRFSDLLTVGGRLLYETHLAPILIAEGCAEEIALDFITEPREVLTTLAYGRQAVDSHSSDVVIRWTIFKATERRNYERELVAVKNLLKTTLSSIGDGVATTDVNGSVVFLNDVAADLSGWDPDLAAGKPIEEVLRLTGEDQGEPIESPARRALRMKAKVGLENHTILVAKDGRQFVIDDSAAPILNENGELFGAVMVFRDVTKRREGERALAAAYRDLEQKAAELRRSNEDLSQFAYAASHDLRSPLNTVTMFSQLLQRNHRDGLGTDGMELVSQIEKATERLGALIQDLLAFSEVSAQEVSRAGKVDAQLAMEIVRNNLRAIIEASGATIDCGPLPVVTVDKTGLVQLFQNLVANSIHYRSAAAPHIQIRAEPEGPFWHFCFRDNGIGIAAEHFERIFQPFKRLHGHDVPGSGIGLSLCRKIVERNGGRIWVESVVGEGSEFHFTLAVPEGAA